MTDPRTDRGRFDAWLLGAIFVTATMQRAWNVVMIPPLTGYDAVAHMAYVWQLITSGSLPHPYAGWSTFHPPLYYMVAAAGWSLLESWGPAAMVILLRGINVVAGLVAALIAYRMLVRGGFARSTVLAATALLLFLPAHQIAATSVGNEGFAAAMVAGALLVALRLQEDPSRLALAATAGLLAGLSAISKYTGCLATIAVLTPFAASLLQQRWNRRHAAALALMMTVAGAVAVPAYWRNYQLTGTPVPMTRTRQPVAGFELVGVLRPRRFSDYLPLNLSAVLRPSLYHVAGRVGSPDNRNPGMANIWGATHASAWFDTFGHRTSIASHRDNVPVGTMLSLLGVVVTATTLGGLLLGVREAVRSRLASWDAPLMAAAVAGISLYVLATTQIPTAFVLKASYMAVVGVALCVAFARGCDALGRLPRAAVLAITTVAIALAAVTFTAGAVYRTIGLGDDGIRAWYRIGLTLPESGIWETVTYAFPEEVDRLQLKTTAVPFGPDVREHP